MTFSLKYCTIILFCILPFQKASSQFIYINPVPESKYRNPETTILLRSDEKIRPLSLKKTGLIKMIGSKSGIHPYSVKLAADQVTILIAPELKFDYNEEVMVYVANGIETISNHILKDTSFSFKIKREYSSKETAQFEKAVSEAGSEEPYKSQKSGEKLMGDSLPGFSLFVDETKAFPGPAFFGTKHNLPTLADQFLCILNNDSTYSLAKNVSNGYGSDFKININGYFTYFGFETHAWYMLDSNYNLIDSFKGKNGYESEVNNHEFQILPNGNKFFLIWHQEIVDMSDTVPGGYEAATVTYPVIQEQDPDDNVIFEWATFDHFSITDATWDVSLTNGVIDPFHTNTIELDDDGNLLISNRNMDEITKINHQTGEIIWRMGGKSNQFIFLNDPLNPPFSHQHDIRRIENGNITLFDNGNLRIPPIPYAKEYFLNEADKTATLVWNYKHPPVNGQEVVSPAAGNVQRLPNGNTLINYGVISDFDSLPNATEVTPDGEIAWEIKFTETEDQTYCYRIHKFLWSPCARPTDYTLIAKSISPSKEILLWGQGNGATQYNLQYRVQGSSAWTAIKSYASRKRIMNLQPNTSYEWRVKTICNQSNNSPYTAIHTFQTAALKMVVEPCLRMSLNLIPNPASDFVTIHFKSDEAGDIQLSLRDLLGEIIYTKVLNVIEGQNNCELNIKDLPRGIYFISLTTNQKTVTEKLLAE